VYCVIAFACSEFEDALTAYISIFAVVLLISYICILLKKKKKKKKKKKLGEGIKLTDVRRGLPYANVNQITGVFGYGRYDPKFRSRI
jgi:hypothetical protein